MLIVADESKAFESLFSHDLVKAVVKRKGLSFIAAFLYFERTSARDRRENRFMKFLFAKKVSSRDLELCLRNVRKSFDENIVRDYFIVDEALMSRFIEKSAKITKSQMAKTCEHKIKIKIAV